MRERRKPTPFGHAVRVRLAQLNLQQRDLACMLGTSDAFITYLIYGDRREEAWVIRICQALGMEEAAYIRKTSDRCMESVEFTAEL